MLRAREVVCEMRLDDFAYEHRPTAGCARCDSTHTQKKAKKKRTTHCGGSIRTQVGDKRAKTTPGDIGVAALIDESFLRAFCQRRNLALLGTRRTTTLAAPGSATATVFFGIPLGPVPRTVNEDAHAVLPIGIGIQATLHVASEHKLRRVAHAMQQRLRCDGHKNNRTHT